MKLCISNIAWTAEQDSEVAQLLVSRGINAIEVAPSRVAQDIANATSDQIDSFRTFWKQHDIEIVAMQALLFNRPELQVFGNDQQQAELLKHLEAVFCMGERLGAKSLVFGSPNNRKRGDLGMAEACVKAAEFFVRVADLCQKHNVFLCLEPNPTEYNCDFLTNTAEGYGFIGLVNRPEIKLHLDSSTMILNKELISALEMIHDEHFSHVHLSLPFLAPLASQPTTVIRELINALQARNYTGHISIEMKSAPEAKDNITNITSALDLVQGLL